MPFSNLSRHESLIYSVNCVYFDTRMLYRMESETFVVERQSKVIGTPFLCNTDKFVYRKKDKHVSQ